MKTNCTRQEEDHEKEHLYG